YGVTMPVFPPNSVAAGLLLGAIGLFGCLGNPGVITSGTGGSTGAAGTTGSSGTTGAAGTTGDAGTTGAAGTTGDAGTTGSAGTTGAAGSAGTTGGAGVGGGGGRGGGGMSGAIGMAGTTGAGGTAAGGGSTGIPGGSGFYRLEKLNRGVVAVQVTGGVYVGWRMFGFEYDAANPANVSYQVFRNGTMVANVTNSTNYMDAGGMASSTYSVRPVIGGTVGAASETATVWAQQYLRIPLMIPPGGNGPSSGCPTNNEAYTYSANDASV